MSGYTRARKTYPARTARPSGPRANQFAGTCATCGTEVRAGAGLLTGSRGNWKITHRPSAWTGSPVSGFYAGGCPGESDRHNLAGQWGPYEHRCADPDHAHNVTSTGACPGCGREVKPVAAPAEVAPVAELVWCEAEDHPVSPHALAGECVHPHNAGTYGDDLTVYRQRCEDAPCCGHGGRCGN